MRQVRSEIEIDATATQIWSVLTDLERFPEWNPYVRRAAGTVEAGRQLQAYLKPPGGRGIGLRLKILQADPPYVLRWRGHLALPGLLDAEHVFEIDCLPGRRCRFIQRETFRGLLVPLAGSLFAETEKGFAAMNRALKTRCEARFGRPRGLEEDGVPSP